MTWPFSPHSVVSSTRASCRPPSSLRHSSSPHDALIYLRKESVISWGPSLPSPPPHISSLCTRSLSLPPRREHHRPRSSVWHHPRSRFPVYIRPCWLFKANHLYRTNKFDIQHDSKDTSELFLIPVALNQWVVITKVKCMPDNRVWQTSRWFPEAQ